MPAVHLVVETDDRRTAEVPADAVFGGAAADDFVCHERVHGKDRVDLRRGRLEAAMIAVPSVTSEGMVVTPVARDELVYISADPSRLETPVSGSSSSGLAAAID